MKAWVCVFLIAVLCWSDIAWAGDNENILTSKPFLDHHADFKWRLEGFRLYDQGDYPGALDRFLKAAHYGDKVSQAMVSEMHRLGQGVPADMAAAYAWMDLAAERGYQDLVIEREKIWARLDEAQQKEAVLRGSAIYREYGDAVAKARMEKILRRASKERTGSRLGAVGRMEVYSVVGRDGPRLGRYGSGDQLFPDRYWKPEHYWKWQDRTLNPQAVGHVDVGPPEPVRNDPQESDESE